MEWICMKNREFPERIYVDQKLAILLIKVKLSFSNLIIYNVPDKVIIDNFVSFVIIVGFFCNTN